MEVHHPHHIPKKFKEYLTEFFMLFAAVTLGFFAENLREHYIEGVREQEYLELIVQDIKMDIQMIDSNMYNRKVRADICNQLTKIYMDESFKKDSGPFYYNARRLHVRYLFERTDAGFQQLKNAGGLRMIRNREIIKAIQHYENSIAALEKFQEGEMWYFENYKLSNAKVLDARVLIRYSGARVSNYNSSLMPQGNPPFVSNDPTLLNEMMTHFFGMDKSNYVVMFFEEKLRKEGEQLIELIENKNVKNYDI